MKVLVYLSNCFIRPLCKWYFNFQIYNHEKEAITWTCLFAFSNLSFSFLPKRVAM